MCLMYEHGYVLFSGKRIQNTNIFCRTYLALADISCGFSFLSDISNFVGHILPEQGLQIRQSMQEWFFCSTGVVLGQKGPDFTADAAERVWCYDWTGVMFRQNGPDHTAEWAGLYHNETMNYTNGLTLTRYMDALSKYSLRIIHVFLARSSYGFGHDVYHIQM